MMAGFSHTSPIVFRVAFAGERKQGKSEAGTVRKSFRSRSGWSVAREELPVIPSGTSRFDECVGDNALSEVYFQLLMTDQGMPLARSGSLSFSPQLRVLRLSLPEGGKIGAAATHNVALVQTKMPVDPNAPHLGYVTGYVCPVIGQVHLKG